MWRGPVGEIEYLVNVMWPLTVLPQAMAPRGSGRPAMA
jgi:hypothetical protein